MIFQCAPGVQTASLYKAVQNTTEACHYRLYFKTQHACVNVGMSSGSVFLLILFVGGTVYFLGGGLFNYLAHGRFEILHKAFWLGLPGLVSDGVLFVKDKITGQQHTFSAVKTGDSGSLDAASASYQSYEDEGQEMGGGNAAAAAYADL
jgi:hypothetical protein